MENSDGSMVINNGKRALFTWKDIHEDLLLQEVLLLEPFQYRSGSKERGAVWSTIAENLSKSGMKVSQRSVREKFDKLVKEFKRKEAMEQRASGIEVEYTERDVAMTDIIERMNELELVLGNKKEKEKQDQATAEEMRMKATERIGQTRKRHSEESEDGELVTPERKRRRNSSDVMDVLKGSLEVKRKEQEEAKKLRERELAYMENQSQRQDEFQRIMLQQQQQFQQQQQQFQQQQQAVTMSVMKALAEITKNLRN